MLLWWCAVLISRMFAGTIQLLTILASRSSWTMHRGLHIALEKSLKHMHISKERKTLVRTLRLQNSALQRDMHLLQITLHCSVNYLALEICVQQSCWLLWVYTGETLHSSVPGKLLKSIAICSLSPIVHMPTSYKYFHARHHPQSIHIG